MSESYPIPFGRYQLIDRLAVGGMAELFLARSTSPAGPQGPVVIKRLLPHMAHDPHFNAMFIDEAKLTSRLTHPNIVETLEFNRHGDQLFMVMEYVEGLDGLAVLRECAHRQVRLPTEIAVHIVHEVLDALDFAHTQVDDHGQPLRVVHRDISPSNVLLSRRGQVKLVDFGIARATQRHHNTKDGTLKGKYGYMSPEQVIDADLDARSDLFSVGIVLSEMLMGRRLFAARNELDVLLMVRDVRLDRLEKYGSHIGVDMQRILRKALRKAPDERFSTAAEFRDVLADWMFLHNYEVTPMTIAQIVTSLYDDAWRRKREAMFQADAARAAMFAGAPGANKQKRMQTADLADKAVSGQVQFVAMERSEAIARPGELDQIDGIPVGHQFGTTDSIPMVSIEDEDEDDVVITGLDSVEASGDYEAVVDGVVQPIYSSDESLTLDMRDLVVDDEVPESGVPELVDDDAATGLVGQANRPAGELDAPATDSGKFPAIDSAADALGSSARDFDDSEVSVAHNPRKTRAASASQNISVEIEELPPEAYEDRPDDQGDFAEAPAIAVLYRLAVARATGLLVTAVGGICKEIYFREGIPEYVSSNVAKELFGEYLTEQGILTAGELAMALAMTPRYGGKLGDTLIGLGLLKPLEVFRHLTRQVRDKLMDVCTWSKGMFRWYGGRENPREAFPLDLNAFEIIGAGTLALSDEIVNKWLKTLDLRCKPRAVADARIHPSVFQLGALMDDVYSRLDGEHYIAELKVYYREQGSYDQFVRLLYLLIQTGLAVTT